MVSQSKVPVTLYRVAPMGFETIVEYQPFPQTTPKTVWRRNLKPFTRIEQRLFLMLMEGAIVEKRRLEQWLHQYSSL
jgi:hypothetical protein